MLPRGCYHLSLRAPIWPGVLGSLLLTWFGVLHPIHVPASLRPSSQMQQSFDSQQAAAPQPPLPQQTANPPVLKHPPIRLAMLRKLYECAKGVQLTVLQEKDAVRLTLNGQIYNLNLVASSQGAAGTNYNAGAITWSVARDTGTLQDATDPSHPMILAQDCRPQSILPPASASSIRGTLNFVPRNDLPATAQVRIQLLDSKASGEPQKTIGVSTFSTTGRKPPIPFEISFDAQSTHATDCCALYAEILVEGKPQYATTKPLPIPDLAHPGPVALQLEPLHRKAPQS